MKKVLRPLGWMAEGYLLYHPGMAIESYGVQMFGLCLAPSGRFWPLAPSLTFLLMPWGSKCTLRIFLLLRLSPVVQTSPALAPVAAAGEARTVAAAAKFILLG